MLFKFLWKGTDKVTRLSKINDHEIGGLKMIDLKSMIKSLRPAWIKRIFGKNDGAWKSYLSVSLQRFEGFFLLYCNYDIKDNAISSLFYSELLQWWSKFRDGFDSGKEWQFILWNNKEIFINYRPIFYEKFFGNDIIYEKDLFFDTDSTNSFKIVSSKISKTNFLIWAGLRHFVPSYLKTDTSVPSEISLCLTIENIDLQLGAGRSAKNQVQPSF